MILLKILLLAAIIGLSLHWWKGREAGIARAPVAGAAASPIGFAPAAMPDGARANTVIILAPVDCPEDAARRADALAAGLARMNIPAARSASYSASVTRPTAEDKAKLDRAMAVINGEIPAVFINGMGKANPSLEEVAAEYRRAQ